MSTTHPHVTQVGGVADETGTDEGAIHDEDGTPT